MKAANRKKRRRLTKPILKFALHVAEEIGSAVGGFEPAAARVQYLEDLDPLLLLVERAEHREAGPGRTIPAGARRSVWPAKTKEA